MPVRGKDEAELHHIEEAVSRFVERELCELLAQSGALEGRLAVERVRLGMTFVEVSLRVLRAASAEDANTNDDVSTSDDVERPLLLSYAERAGTLVARIEAGRAADLPERARAALADAMHGLLRRSDVARIELAHESEAGDSAPPALAPEPIGWAAWVARWEAERASASPTPAHAPGPLGPSLLGPT